MKHLDATSGSGQRRIGLRAIRIRFARASGRGSRANASTSAPNRAKTTALYRTSRKRRTCSHAPEDDSVACRLLWIPEADVPGLSRNADAMAAPFWLSGRRLRSCRVLCGFCVERIGECGCVCPGPGRLPVSWTSNLQCPMSNGDGKGKDGESRGRAPPGTPRRASSAAPSCKLNIGY